MPARTKKQSWDSFVSWCVARGLSPAPAHPWTMSAYLRSLEAEMQLASIERHLNLIGEVHFEKLRKRPDRDPMVRKTLTALRRRAEAKRKPPPPPALFQPDDFLDDAKPLRRPTNDVSSSPRQKGRRALRSEPRLVRKKRL